MILEKDYFDKNNNSNVEDEHKEIVLSLTKKVKDMESEIESKTLSTGFD